MLTVAASNKTEQYIWSISLPKSENSAIHVIPNPQDRCPPSEHKWRYFYILSQFLSIHRNQNFDSSRRTKSILMKQPI